MSQIMRLRRRAGNDYGIEDRNNGLRHEHAFVTNIRKNGILHEGDLLPDSYGGKFHPRAVPVLMGSLPVVVTGLMRRKMTPGKVLRHPHRKEYKGLKDYFDKIEARDERLELNLYITGYDEDDEGAGETAPGGVQSGNAPDGGQPGQSPEESPAR
jgi:succinate dehydrogenase / fumarate reductase iron-sulfur subunit